MTASSKRIGGSGRYLVGIDLGTTHTAVAFADTHSGADPAILLFEIEQLVAPGEFAACPLLPSVRYHPAPDELAPADTRLPWPEDRGADGATAAVFGRWARILGGKSHGRLVTSAKSWLSHRSVDRAAPVLPWGAPADVAKVSPIDASASYLAYVRRAWDARFADCPLARQDVVVTVPASFDEDARALTLEAAARAGLTGVRLLEEPQAACYDWLWQHRTELSAELAGVHLILVCDVGGGTSDFALLSVETGAGAPRVTRIGVGTHLMLGGDNIDLAVAHAVEQRLGDGRRLSAAELALLVEQCRGAKESLLGSAAPEAANVTLLGSGARLVGGARSVAVTRGELIDRVLEGFFPLVELDALPDRRRSGVVEFGLPYAADPAITRHLAAFLAQHGELARQATGLDIPVPDALLLNGGVFRSDVIAARVVRQLETWAGMSPRLLQNDRPDLAVAHGAVAYGLARRGRSVQRIGGGAARSYFLLVESAGPDRQGVCVMPRGTEEGREIALPTRRYSLKMGQPVRFHLYSSRGDRTPEPGDLVSLDDDAFDELPPLAVAFQDAEAGARGERLVHLVATMTDIGTLDLRCVAVDDPDRRWRIEFLLRPGQVHESAGDERSHPRIDEAVASIGAVFGKKDKNLDPRAVKGLRSSLERVLGPRDVWDTGLCRRICDALLEGAAFRRRGADHERAWFNLMGFCLRPGFGYPLDDWRVDRVWALYPQGLQYPNEAQNWAEWWTMWRRVAGGLSTEAQTRIFADIEKFIDPAALRTGKVAAIARKRAAEDMVRLSASLERLSADRKASLGEWLWQRLGKSGESPEVWWALARVGGRVPLHGSAHEVVGREVAERWVERLLGEDLKNQPSAAFAATMITRMSGDRERDVGDSLRAQVIEQLRAAKAPESWRNLVTRVEALDHAEQKRIFGEALPPGLRLVDEDPRD